MDMQEMKRIFKSNEGMMLTIMFTMIFIVTNLIMVDVRGVQNLITDHGQTPFFILIMILILAYLYKNSTVEINKPRAIFLAIWNLYVISMFISMLVNRDFVWPEALVLVLLTMMFCFKLPKDLLIIMVTSALVSLLFLLLQADTLNESGATLVLIYTAGLIFIPRHNKAMLYYGLPAFALLLFITESRTAIAVFILVAIFQLVRINLFGKSKTHRKRFFYYTYFCACITHFDIHKTHIQILHRRQHHHRRRGSGPSDIRQI